eukprot:14281496-Heterocapsa_arctica.AAC.1
MIEYNTDGQEGCLGYILYQQLDKKTYAATLVKIIESEEARWLNENERTAGGVHTSTGLPVPDGEVQSARGNNGTSDLSREQAHDDGRGGDDGGGGDRGYPDLEQR